MPGVYLIVEDKESKNGHDEVLKATSGGNPHLTIAWTRKIIGRERLAEHGAVVLREFVGNDDWSAVALINAYVSSYTPESGGPERHDVLIDVDDKVKERIEFFRDQEFRSQYEDHDKFSMRDPHVTCGRFATKELAEKRQERGHPIIMSLVKIAEEYVSYHMKDNDGSHDLQHIKRVKALAIYIAKQEGAKDMEMIILAAILHDVRDWKYEDATGCVTSSLLDVLSLLFKDKMPRSRIQILHDIIQNVGFSSRLDRKEGTEVSEELAIVQDADQLDAIGAIGIARAFTFGGTKNRMLFDPDVPYSYCIPSSKEEYQTPKRQGGTFNHFYEKLLHIKDLINTSTGKKLAKERHRILIEFVERFQAEHAFAQEKKQVAIYRDIDRDSHDKLIQWAKHNGIIGIPPGCIHLTLATSQPMIELQAIELDQKEIVLEITASMDHIQFLGHNKEVACLMIDHDPLFERFNYFNRTLQFDCFHQDFQPHLSLSYHTHQRIQHEHTTLSLTVTLGPEQVGSVHTP